MPKYCTLDNNKICDNCGECLYCDLDPSKICDNCCKCLDLDSLPDYSVIEIDEIILDASTSSAKPERYRITKGASNIRRRR